MLQYTGVYCNRGSWVRLGICIAIQKLYCDCGARARLDCIAIQWPAKPRYSRGVAGSWARKRGAGRAAGRGKRAGGRAGSRQGARAAGARTAGSCARGVRSRGAEGARPGRWARGLGAGRAAWAHGLALGCALYALGLFSIRFDSVLFLSQFLDVVCEPGS